MNGNWNDIAGHILVYGIIGLFAVYVITGLDDLFIDLVAWFNRIKPRFLSPSDIRSLAESPQKNIAIIVPAWDEGCIIKRMLLGNRARIEYDNYHFFVGYYPNDPETCDAVSELEITDPRIHAVENFKNGPTCKGQILNWMIDWILDWEARNGTRFDAFLMQDSEDLIHAKSLQLVNHELENADFVQIPVFSLPLKMREMVAGVYVDEFAESHTKDVLVRDWFGGGVPSAGVGTAMSRAFVLSRVAENDGQLFRDGCLTEDYELGIVSAINGAKQVFASRWYMDDKSGQCEFIATREFFPKAFRRSVRQKTRWTMGIALQCWRSVGWKGSAIQRYFLYRDRRGLITNPAMVFGYLWAVLILAMAYHPDWDVSVYLKSETMSRVGLVTGFFAVNRLFQRMICTTRVYGWKTALMAPVRLPIGNLINGLAVIQALYKDLKSRITNTSVSWSKTQHELPDDFGGVTMTTPGQTVPVPMTAGRVNS